MNLDGKVERTGGSWEKVDINVDTLKQMEEIMGKARGYEVQIDDLTEEDVESFLEEVEEAFLYRKGSEAIGNLNLSYSKEDGSVHVVDLSVLPEHRSAGITLKLLALLQEIAARKNIQSISWTSASDIMDKLTEKVGAEIRAQEWDLPDNTKASYEYRAIAVDKLDQETLMQIIKRPRD